MIPIRISIYHHFQSHVCIVSCTEVNLKILKTTLIFHGTGCMYVSFIGLRLTKTSLTLINRTRLY